MPKPNNPKLCKPQATVFVCFVCCFYVCCFEGGVGGWGVGGLGGGGGVGSAPWLSSDGLFVGLGL